MTSECFNIRRLIKILGPPNGIIQVPLIVWGDTHFDYLMTTRVGYKLLKSSEINKKDRILFGGVDTIDYEITNEDLCEEDEKVIQAILEQILLEP